MAMLLYNKNVVRPDMKNHQIAEFRFLLPLAAIYNMLWLLAIFIDPTVVHWGKFEVSASTFLVILFFSLNDVITEVYGYRIMKKVIWSTMFSLFIMIFLIFIVLSIPGITTWPDAQYKEILNSSALVAISGIIASLVSSFMNSYLLSRWKVLLRGRYYLGRSITTTAISAFFFTIIAYSYHLAHLPLERAMKYIISAYIIKLIADVIIAFPCTFLQYYLKRLENVDVFDIGVKFNIFSLKEDNVITTP